MDDYKELQLGLLEANGDSFQTDDAFNKVGIWSKLTFQWLNPLFSKGHKQRLEVSDIPSIPVSEMAKNSYALLSDRVENSSLAKAVLSAVWRPLLLNATFAGTYAVASYTGPLLIANFIALLSGKNGSSDYHGMILAFIFFAAKTVESLSEAQWNFGARRISIRIRAALLSLIYRKVLLVKSDGSRTGKIVNHINTDIEKVVELIEHLQEVWLLPVQVILALFILSKHLGWIPSILAITTTCVMMASNTPLAKLQKRLHVAIMEAKDSRIKFTSESLKSMKVLKLHAWESTFLKKILQLREIERGWIIKYLYTKALVVFLYWASPMFISIVMFGVCTALQEQLSAGSIFSALATLQILHEPLYNTPELVSIITQARISLDRLQEFLREESQEKSDVNYTSRPFDPAIHISKGAYCWETSNANSCQPTIIIHDNIQIMKGKKVAICGSVGSGKSSLLYSILGEMPRIYGSKIEVFGSKAYVPQANWIQSGTVKENIMFGNKMEEQFYRNVIKACSLEEDIQRLVNNDSTVVGERGMKLSGGQKQRVQLARAIYRNADVYLLDDPFSAVDAHTKAHLFKHCLMDLLADKTVIYVTHQLEFLAAADVILVMKDGKIVQWGTYNNLLEDPNGELNRLIVAHCEPKSQVRSSHDQNMTSIEHQNQHYKERNDSKQVKSEAFLPTNTKEVETGRVNWRAYSTFIFTAYKGAYIPVIIIFHLLFQGLQMVSNYWIAWATEKEGKVGKKQLIAIFALISSGSSIFVLARALLLTAITIKTSQNLFIGMIKSVFKAPMSFFDATSSSQILDRSSTDQTTVDSDISYRIAGLVFALIQLICAILLMSHVAWQVSLLFISVFAISAWYQAFYLETARELARMVGIQKAPLLNHFSESISGVATIRCFNQEETFDTTNRRLIDDFSRISFHNSATMKWLCVRINFLFNFGFFVVLVILVTKPGSISNPSLAGLAVMYGLNINVLQAWIIWNICNIENKMISVQRILQFSSIPSEAPSVIKNHRPRPQWPEIGRIEFINMQVQYGLSLPLVLKGITCTFPGEKKIGIVGRTGSGKSTLIQAIFRLVDPVEGCIFIDGIDISKIGLQDLRSKLSIIPQEPTLFQGTLRNNLDPLEKHTDYEIWEVLRKCHLTDMVRQNHGLDAQVADEGQNWSIGQRQLICLARILLHKNKILVLDEATASIDTATDSIIQKTLKNETNNCTVINVAHRITTVIDSDLVMVLDDGIIVEFAAPAQLLSNSSSSFSKLVKEFSGNAIGADA